MIGYAFCGSFCTLSRSLNELERLVGRGEDVIPFISERVYGTDTRFWKCRDFIKRVEDICGRNAVHTVEGAEPYGPKRLDYMVISPCTGNTLGKIACGITDSAVTMAAKAHLRSDGRLHQERARRCAHSGEHRYSHGDPHCNSQAHRNTEERQRTCADQLIHEQGLIGRNRGY